MKQRKQNNPSQDPFTPKPSVKCPTIFETWCQERGFDPKGEFFVIHPDSCDEFPIKGDLIKLYHDDDTLNPVFINKYSRCWPVFVDKLSQNKEFDADTFNYKDVLPKCWVRNDLNEDWKEAHFLEMVSGLTKSVNVIFQNHIFNVNTCIFKNPHKDVLRKRAEALRSELAQIEKELSE
jgi:hypothetical protein